ncbi:MAG TPA: M14 family metallopeptidase [Bacteroidota bacterium]|nr:M14 family metallopeptidase [Bacteroidota bacterium]
MKLSFLLLLCCANLFSQSVPEKWLTYYEQSGYKKTPRYKETMEYCRKLEKASPWIKVTNFGKSPEGRDLPLVIVSKEQAFDPQKAAKSGKVIMLIQNGIHSGEIEGKDASLMLLRDIAITKTKASLLDHVILLVIPIYNVDGHERFGPYNRINQNGPEEMGWRVTSQNLNLNRDYMKADAPETQFWLRLFNDWLPDFFVDCHVTDGADYQYVVTFGIENTPNVAPPVREWITQKFLPQISSLKTNGNIPVGQLIFLRDDLDPMKGLAGVSGTAPPRFSTVYTTLQNRPGVLIEMHMLKDYKSRVEGNYEMLDAIIQKLNAENASLRSAVRRADEQTTSGLPHTYALTYRGDTLPNHNVTYAGFRQKNEASDISTGTRRSYTREPFEASVPAYDSVIVDKTVEMPFAYLIPQQYQTIIYRLKLHGIKFDRLTSPVDIDVERYRLTKPKWATAPFEGHIGVTTTTEKFREKTSFPAGTIVVPMHQRTAKVAAQLLEPDAPDSFVGWGFFDAIFEQKEYAEDYVMEKVSREMMQRDPKLRQDFDDKVASDSGFAKSASARLNFFYEHSPYWDNQINLYPVARLMTETSLSTDRTK